MKGKSQFSQVEHIISVDAQVPGCAQLNLSKAGYLPEELFLGENIRKTEKYEGYEWWYERKFNAPKERENLHLVFESVDCLAEYFLNGVKLGESKISAKSFCTWKCGRLTCTVNNPKCWFPYGYGDANVYDCKDFHLLFRTKNSNI